MRRLFAFFLLFALTLPASKSARAQSIINVTDLLVSYRFGEQVTIQARLNAPASITDATILLRTQGETNIRSEQVPVDPDGRIRYQYAFSQGPLRTFARIDFWFHVTLQTGEQLDTAPFFFYYNDDRFPWQMVEESGIRIHWYAGDESFGRAALNAARTGLQKTGTMLSVSLSRPIDIYIYATAADMQTALEIGGQSYVGGHASPDLGVGLVAIAPGPEQGLEMDRKIPHELAHILTYQIAGEHYNALPVWLREGIASLAELFPNPDHALAISLAVEQQSIIPILNLCGSFPPEASRIFLAYAESASFTRYLATQYGNSKLVALIHAYADGLDCEQGSLRTLGRPLSEIEGDWRSTVLGENRGLAAFENLFPYLAVLAVILIVPLAFALTVKRMDYAEQPPEKQ